MAASGTFKRNTRQARNVTVEDSFSNGVYVSDTPTATGYSRTLVNYRIDNNTKRLVNRPGLYSEVAYNFPLIQLGKDSLIGNSELVSLYDNDMLNPITPIIDLDLATAPINTNNNFLGYNTKTVTTDVYKSNYLIEDLNASYKNDTIRLKQVEPSVIAADDKGFFRNSYTSKILLGPAEGLSVHDNLPNTFKPVPKTLSTSIRNKYVNLVNAGNTLDNPTVIKDNSKIGYNNYLKYVRDVDADTISSNVTFYKGEPLFWAKQDDYNTSQKYNLDYRAVVLVNEDVTPSAIQKRVWYEPEYKIMSTNRANPLYPILCNRYNATDDLEIKTEKIKQISCTYLGYAYPLSNFGLITEPTNYCVASAGLSWYIDLNLQGTNLLGYDVNEISDYVMDPNKYPTPKADRKLNFCFYDYAYLKTNDNKYYAYMQFVCSTLDAADLFKGFRVRIKDKQRQYVKDDTIYDILETDGPVKARQMYVELTEEDYNTDPDRFSNIDTDIDTYIATDIHTLQNKFIEQKDYFVREAITVFPDMLDKTGDVYSKSTICWAFTDVSDFRAIDEVVGTAVITKKIYPNNITDSRDFKPKYRTPICLPKYWDALGVQSPKDKYSIELVKVLFTLAGIPEKEQEELLSHMTEEVYKTMLSAFILQRHLLKNDTQYAWEFLRLGFTDDNNSELVYYTEGAGYVDSAYLSTNLEAFNNEEHTNKAVLGFIQPDTVINPWLFGTDALVFNSDGIIVDTPGYLVLVHPYAVDPSKGLFQMRSVEDDEYVGPLAYKSLKENINNKITFNNKTYYYSYLESTYDAITLNDFVNNMDYIDAIKVKADSIEEGVKKILDYFINSPTANVAGAALYGLNITDNKLNNEAYTTYCPSVSTAISTGYNMLLDDPYSFSVPTVTNVTRVEACLLYRNWDEVINKGTLAMQVVPGEALKGCAYISLAQGVSCYLRLSYRLEGSDAYVVFVTKDISDSTLSSSAGKFYFDFTAPAENFYLKVELYYMQSSSFNRYEQPLYEIELPYTIAESTESVEYLPNYDLSSAQGILSWKGRLYLWGVPDAPNIIFASDILYPLEYFPYPNNIIEYDEPVLHAIKFLDKLLVFTESHIYQTALGTDGASWTTTTVAGNLTFTPSEIYSIAAIKNMLFYKCKNYYYMLVPSTNYLTLGELKVANISEPIYNFLDTFYSSVTEIINTMYPALKGATLIPETYSVHTDGDVVKVNYGFSTVVDETTVSFIFVLNYDTLNRIWYFDVVQTPNTGCLSLYRNNLLGNAYYMYTQPEEDYVHLDLLNYNKGKQDFYSNTLIPTRQFYDSGYKNINPEWKKRFREVQFKVSQPDSKRLYFKPNFILDEENRLQNKNYMLQLIEGGDYIYAPSEEYTAYGKATLEPSDEEYFLELGGENFDSHKFNLLRCKVSGKGYYPRFQIVGDNQIPYEIHNINWVFRNMNLR